MWRRIVLVGIIALVFSHNGVACSRTFSSPSNALKNADLVFRGRLVNVEYIDAVRYTPHPIVKGRRVAVPRRFLATLEVSEVWKGRVGHRIVLHTREGSSDCVGFWTEIGKEYLVFANTGRITPKEQGVFRIPEWTDKLEIGKEITSPGVCTLNEQIDANTGGTLKALGKSRLPLR